MPPGKRGKDGYMPRNMGGRMGPLISTIARFTHPPPPRGRGGPFTLPGWGALRSPGPGSPGRGVPMAYMPHIPAPFTPGPGGRSHWRPWRMLFSKYRRGGHRWGPVRGRRGGCPWGLKGRGSGVPPARAVVGGVPGQPPGMGRSGITAPHFVVYYAFRSCQSPPKM